MKKIYVHSPSHPGPILHLPAIYFLLKADYKKHGTQNLNWIEPMVRQEDEDTCMQYLRDNGGVDYFVISVYSWNVDHHHKLAKRVKREWPDCTIIAGGYEVTTKWEQHDYIDKIVIGDPETVFAKIVDGVITEKVTTNYLREWNTSAILDNHVEYHNMVASTHLYEGEKLAYVYETNRGCPYSCTFCAWGDANRKKIIPKELDVIKQELDVLLKSNITVLRVSDANFGIMHNDKAIAEHMVHLSKQRTLPLDHIDFSWAKNNKDKVYEIVEVLGNLINRFKYGVQDTAPDVATAIRRAEKKTWDRAFDEYKSKGPKNVPLRLDLIIGLPGQSKDRFFIQMQQFMDLDLDIPNVYLCNILPNTEMANPEYQEEYGIKFAKEKASTVPAYIKGDKHPMAKYVYNNEYTIDCVTSTHHASMSDIGEMIVFAGMCKFMKHLGIKNKDFIDMYIHMFSNPAYGKTFRMTKNAYAYTSTLHDTSRLNIPLVGIDSDVLCAPGSYFYATLMDTDEFQTELNEYLCRPHIKYEPIPKIIDRIRKSWNM